MLQSNLAAKLTKKYSLLFIFKKTLNIIIQILSNFATQKLRNLNIIEILH